MSYAIKIRTKYRNDNTGRELQLPAVFTENGPIISHLRYLATKTRRSASWRERCVFSLLLLIRYINANQNSFSKTTELLRSFVSALNVGTINPTTLEDPSQLYWPPRRLSDANAILGHITLYTDWLADQDEHGLKIANPFRRATSIEERLNWCAYYHKHNQIFLNHLTDTNKSREELKAVREIRTQQVPIIHISNVKRFPEAEIGRLLEHGFVRPHSSAQTSEHQQPDYKSQAITLLMHYGGIRISEALQLYLTDIVIDKTRTAAVVRVHHPSDGASPIPNYSCRREYLAKQFRLIPRTEYPKTTRLHLGWKDPLLSDRRGFFQVLFFPAEKATEFLLVWKNYLIYQRTDPPPGQEHPYAFTNNIGAPESLKNFQRLHKNAAKRIGLEHKKYNGTSEHGHRHAYGYRLSEHGFNQIEIQKAMHHKSPQSCLVYTQPSDIEMAKKMREVE